MSTTPVREALRELAGEGLLDLDPHRGVVVHQCRVQELHEIYTLRMLLEPVAIAAMIKSITAEELNAAERLVEGMERVQHVLVELARAQRDRSACQDHLANFLGRGSATRAGFRPR